MAVLEIIPNYKPHAKQVLLHNAPVSFEDIWVILYGGARGAGKSAGALGDAFMFAQTYPGAKIAIFRERLDAVKQSFLDKMPQLFPEKIKDMQIYEYKDRSTKWYPARTIVFPNGSYITFQRVASYKEALAFQGWEFHMLIIDEVTKQEKRTVDYLMSCVRSATITNPYTGQPLKIPTKVIFGCNPGGIGHKWVKERYIDTTVTKYDSHNTPVQTKDHMEIVYTPAGDPIKTYIRFIPASYKDNPYLNKSYIANLMNQPEHKKQMDLFGNWDVVAGKYFDFHEEQFVTPAYINHYLKKYDGRLEFFIAIDWGFKPSFHSAHWYAVSSEKKIVVFKELYGQELVFEDFVEEIRKESEGMDISATCLPHDMFRSGDRYRDSTGKIIGETKSDVFENAGLNPISVQSGKGKVDLRYDKIHSATTMKCDDDTYKVIISEACPMLKEELENAVHDDVIPGNLAPECADHAIDDFGLFLVYFSDDIEPLGFVNMPKPDNRSHLQRILDEDEERLEEEEADNYFVGVDNYF
jgi:phage terminase large subunit